MPNEYTTFGMELVSRHASVPYFSGRGGVTSPNGWNSPIGNPTNYTADLVKEENRLIFSSIFRFYKTTGIQYLLYGFGFLCYDIIRTFNQPKTPK